MKFSLRPLGLAARFTRHPCLPQILLSRSPLASRRAHFQATMPRWGRAIIASEVAVQRGPP